MKITYIYHSGFTIETDKIIIVIDFYHDTDIVGGYVRDTLLGDETRKMYVLATHFHPDHFSPEILEWKELRGNIEYIMSKDILKHRRPDRAIATWMVKGDTFNDGNIEVKAFGSTDIGVSLMINIEGKKIFHAGDLNNWAFATDDEETATRRTKRFLGELKDIKKETDHFDWVMFPIDARLGDTFTDGAQAFAKTFDIENFIPMHFSECGYESANTASTEIEPHVKKFHRIIYKGQHICK